jgi:hypothetical protein
MRSFFPVIVFLIILTGNADQGHAECADMLDTEFQTNIMQNVDNISGAISSAFPFSLILFAKDILTDLAGVTAESFTSAEISLFGITITPLSVLDNSGFDMFMQFLRVATLVIVIFSVVKHVLENIL